MEAHVYFVFETNIYVSRACTLSEHEPMMRMQEALGTNLNRHASAWHPQFTSSKQIFVKSNKWVNMLLIRRNGQISRL